MRSLFRRIYASLSMRKTLAEMWMRHFFISREHRRHGYGRTAVALLFDKLGTDEIGLSCLTKNEAGQAFWRSFKHDAHSVKFFIQKPEI